MPKNNPFDDVWNKFGNGTFEDIILAKATKLKNLKTKGEKLEALEELSNYTKRYMNRLITGR
jgi:hypothetical protein